jgi:hypothetical protein
VSCGNHLRLAVLPPEAIRVAAAAGAEQVGTVWGGDIDLARGRPATQSTVAATTARTTEDLSRLADGCVDGPGDAGSAPGSPEAAAAIAVDGDTCTDTATRDEPGSWWRVDLGTERHVGTVDLWNAESMITRDVVVELTDAAGRTTASRDVSGLVRRPTIVLLDAPGRFVTVRRMGGGLGLASVAVRPGRGAQYREAC